MVTKRNLQCYCIKCECLKTNLHITGWTGHALMALVFFIKQHNQRPLQGFHDCHIEWAPRKTEWCVPLGWSGSGGSNESTMVKDLSFPLMHHDPSDPGLFPDLDCSNGTHSLIWTSNLTLNWISQSAKETSFVEAWHG